MDIDTSVPFPLAYLDWCKSKGIKSLKDTEDNALIMEFGRLYSQKGGKIEAYEILIARGDKII